MEERLTVGQRPVETGEVTVSTRVVTEERPITLRHVATRYRERRVPVNREVSTVPAPRTENGATILPVVREEVVLTKRLILVEEIYLEPVAETTEESVIVPLRHHEVTIERKNYSRGVPPRE